MTTVFHSATVHTMDTAAPKSDAFAVDAGRIVAVGDAARALLEQGADSVDLTGYTVLPGIIDVHNHHNHGGRRELTDLTFPPTANLDEILAAVRSRASETSAGEWIYGGSVGSGLIGTIDTAEALAALDDVSGDHPVLLTDDSLHNRWANSLAMQKAGIGADTPNPDGGVISRDSAGNATGWLIESAGVLVELAKAADQPESAEALKASTAKAVEMLNAYGITGFQDAAASLQIMEAVKALDDAGELNSWVVSSTPVEEFIFGYQPVGEDVIFGMEHTRSEHHKPDFIKIFLDGVPPALTAAFVEPYLPAEGHACTHGHMTMPYEELETWLLRTAERGISAKIHCTGDASVRAVLDAVQKVREAGYDDVLYQVAHGQFITEEDIPRFAELNVAADISPSLWFPGVIIEAIKSVLGEERGSKAHPNRALTDAGALIAAGSDWPVSVSPNPWEAIYGLVTRKDPTGEFPGELWPEQALTREEALATYTINSARAMGLDQQTGSITEGKAADFVILETDPLTCPVEDIITIQPVSTWFAGKKVFTATS